MTAFTGEVTRLPFPSSFSVLSKQVLGFDHDLIRSLALDFSSALVLAFDPKLTFSFDLGPFTIAEHIRDFENDLSLALARDVDLARTRDLARALALRRARGFARSLEYARANYLSSDAVAQAVYGDARDAGGLAAAIHVVPQTEDLLAKSVRAVGKLAIPRMSGRERDQAVLQDVEVVLQPLHVVITGVRRLEGRRRGRGHSQGHEREEEYGQRSFH